jgi:multiple sugar transport system permease protein
VKRSDRIFILLLTAPAIIFFLIFFIYPILLLIFNSFYDYSLLSGERIFIGFANFKEILTSKNFFLTSLQTIKFTAIVSGAEFFLGFIVALLFNIIGKKSEILRTIFLFPLMLAPIVAGLLWKFILIDDFGILNYVLTWLGIIKNPGEIAWLSNPDIVLYSVALPDIWLTTCFVALVIYTGLQNIPVEFLEAAKIDGANPIQSFWNITIPLLRPVIAVVIIIRGIDAARTFDAIWIMTEGGPMNKSEVLSLRIYLTMIRYGRVGEASAMGTIFLVFLVALGLFAFYKIWKPIY